MNKKTKRNLSIFLCVILLFFLFNYRNNNEVMEDFTDMNTFNQQQAGISDFEKEQVDPSGFGELVTELGSLWNHYIAEPASKWDSKQDHIKRDIDTHRYATGGDGGMR